MSLAELAAQFHALFAGLDRAYGTYNDIDYDAPRQDGKCKGKAVTVQQPVTEKLWALHLTGKNGLGIVPLRDDSTVVFGAIDIDMYADLDHARIAAKLEELKMPLIPCRSKSGGCHVYLFCSEPITASKMQSRLRDIAASIGYGNAEIFPKQDRFTEPTDGSQGSCGSWINMPYFDATNTNRYAIDAEGMALSVEQFLTLAEQSRVGQEFFAGKILEMPKPKTNGKGRKKHFVLPAEIPLGVQDNTLTQFAGKLRHDGLGPGEILIALRTVSHERCKPPVEEKDLERIARSVARYEPGDEEGGKRNKITEILTELTSDVELFHTPKDEGYASVEMNGHRECHAVKSEKFQGILRSRYYKRTKDVIGTDTLDNFIKLLYQRAIDEGPERPTHMRFAHVDGRVYLDLCNDRWEVVEIDKDGWRVLSSSPVCFRRVAGMNALPCPNKGGSLAMIRPLINARRENHFILMMSWLFATFLGEGAFPILLLQGTEGTAKSGTSTVLRNTVDPVNVPVNSLPTDERNLAIMAHNRGILAFDNVSGLPHWLSDALCRVATGAGFTTRTLHTDADEQLFDMRRPVLLNGIDDIASRADLLDRSISIYLKPIPDNERKTLSEVNAGFATVHSEVLGALLTAVSEGLKNLPNTKLSNLPRMADFVQWVVAAEPALPWETGEFIRVYFEARQKAAQLSVENDMVASALLRMIKGIKSHAWEGSAEDLLDQLDNEVRSERRDKTSWPKNAASMGKWLRRAEKSLRTMGVLFSARREPGTGARVLRVEYFEPGEPKQGTLPIVPEDEAA